MTIKRDLKDRKVRWGYIVPRKLDKKVYRKGDLIKGRIDFECVEEEMADPEVAKKYVEDPATVKVRGVFKTIVK